MPLINFSAGGVPTESDLDTVSRQGVITGNTAPSGPTEGMCWYDTNAAHPLIYSYNGSDWRPLPMGLVAKGTITDTGTVPPYNIGGTYVTITDSDLTVDTEADQRYRYSADFHIACNEANDLFEVQLQQWDGSSWNDWEDPFIVQTPGGSGENTRVHVSTIDGPGAGTFGWRIRIKLYYGTGSGEIHGGTDVQIEHIGGVVLP